MADARDLKFCFSHFHGMSSACFNQSFLFGFIGKTRVFVTPELLIVPTGNSAQNSAQDSAQTFGGRGEQSRGAYKLVPGFEDSSRILK